VQTVMFFAADYLAIFTLFLFTSGGIVGSKGGQCGHHGFREGPAPSPGCRRNCYRSDRFLSLDSLAISLNAPPGLPIRNRGGPTSKGRDILINWPQDGTTSLKYKAHRNAEFPIVPTFFNGHQTLKILRHLGTQKDANLCLKCTKIRLAAGLHPNPLVERKRSPKPFSHNP